MAENTISGTKPYSYEYKDPDRHGAGRYYGVMAQDLAKSPAGRSTLLKDERDGTMMIDTSRLTMLNTAAISSQQRELEEFRNAFKNLFPPMQGQAYGGQ